MTYRIKGLDPSPYRPLFTLSEGALAEHGIVRMNVTDQPGFPCRVSLTDRPVGESVLLLHHVSHDVSGPYRASHAIFVADAEQAEFVDTVPPVFARRVLSLRGFDDDGMMVDALITQPGDADGAIRQLFDKPEIANIHAHNAARGCFSARIERY